MSTTKRRRGDAADPNTSARRSERRDRRGPEQSSFFERYRTLLVGAAVVAAIVVVGAFVFVGATSPTYACSTEWQPTGADADRLGVPQDDMGRGHVQAGEFVRYTYCPPASGDHVNRAGQGPIDARFYGPGDQAPPQGWIHNLEHGGMVVLYRCGDGPCDEADQRALRDMLASFPTSPVCGLPAGVQGPVIARFEEMPHDFAAMLWGRVLYQDELDTDEMIEFFMSEGERGAPEPQCAPGSMLQSPEPSVTPEPS